VRLAPRQPGGLHAGGRPGHGGRDQAAGFAGLLAHLRDLAALGVGHVMLSHQGPWTEASLAALAAILPEVHAIPVAG